MKKKLLFLCLFVLSFFLLYALNNTIRETIGYNAFHTSKDIGQGIDVIKKSTTSTCNALNLPFNENFQSTSITKDCWTIIDGNQDGETWYVSQDWSTGNEYMMFNSYTANQDDWLITPALVSSNKFVRIDYTIQTDPGNINEMGVYLSTTGNNAANFTTIVKSKMQYKNSTFVKTSLVVKVPAGNFYVGWHVTSESNIQVENISIQEMDCAEPTNQNVTQIQTNQATINWEDTYNTSWEYYIQTLGGNIPNSAQATVNTQSTTVNVDHTGAALQPNTLYEFYVRAKCTGNTVTNWVGPYAFKTACLPLTTIPFVESFDSSSNTFDCWTIINNNQNPKQWEKVTTDTYAGDGCMLFEGNSPPNDSWLISPTLSLGSTKNIYQLTFYYKSDIYTPGQFDLLLSENGSELTDFKKNIVSKKLEKIGNYIKEIYFINDLSGNINFAWRVHNADASTVYIDEVKFEKIDCMGVYANDIKINSITPTSAQITWTDTNNSSWEIYTQPAGGAVPITSGTITNTKSVTINSLTNGGGALTPNTNYEFYLRTKCGTNGKGTWTGPIQFKTACNSMALPFWEGFNTNSQTTTCWGLINSKNETPWSNKWEYVNDNYEGDRSISYVGNEDQGVTQNAWLLSPSFDIVSTKSYRLRYHYKTSMYNTNSFDVKLSTKGQVVDNYTQTLQTRKDVKVGAWKQETVIISGITGTISIGWHVNGTDSGTSIHIDNVFMEEVDCPEATELNADNIKINSFDINWKDNVGNKWEYTVQPKGTNLPPKTGVTTTTKNNTITIDNAGKAILPNTEYEYYVRAICAQNKQSEWMGPYRLRTLCDIQKLPHWEGFNMDSETYYCWSTVSIKNNVTSQGNWKREKWPTYEGTHAMQYSINDWMNNTLSDEWLISPTYTFKSGKIYKLMYHYQTDEDANNTNTFEVLGSNKGAITTNFTKVVIPEKAYNNANFVQEKAFISGLSGNVNLAWHVKGIGSKSIIIDNVFVEEVENCPEPLNLDVQDIEKNKATLTWTDDFNATDWEYFVQPVNSKLSIPTGAGTATKVKSVTTTTDNLGQPLKPNTEYEYYVRTKCADGKFSIWAGPIRFYTLCDTLSTPFWDGFNTNQDTWRCWTMIDQNNDGKNWQLIDHEKYEGDRSISFNSYNAQSDKWLISPTINTTNDLYVLKYHYKASSWTPCNFEVMISNSGTSPQSFTKTLINLAEYDNAAWKEQVIFFTASAGTTNIGWHINATQPQQAYIDNVSIKKVENCPEPYYVETTNITSNSIDLEWQQDAGIASWEVIVVPYKADATTTPLQTITVTGNPKATISSLSPMTGYTFYVRAKCNNKSTSDWSTALHSGTKVDTNNACNTAIKLEINTKNECIKQRTISTLDGNPLTSPAPNCFNPFGTNTTIWLEFKATSTSHKLTLNDVISLSDQSTPGVNIALFAKDCNNLTTPMECGGLNDYKSYQKVFSNLIPGQDYLIQMEIFEGHQLFNVCLTTSNSGGNYLETSESGDKYTVEELVSDVLINSNCNLVSNVRYQAGDGKNTINSLAYFNKGKSDFPFKEGIVLATHAAKYIEGPYQGFESEKIRIPFWKGDPDLNNVIDQIGGAGFGDDKAVAVLEFDFIPVKDSIHFEYIFVSDSFNKGCSVVCQPGGALFAAWLTEIDTGEGQNLALVPGTKSPIAISTIRDSHKSGAACNSVNPQYYDKNYDYNVDDPLDAPVNYTGVTVPMSSETVHVKPGKKYHIKFAIADFCGFLADASAVFFNAGSFDLGNLNLGKDLLVETGNALCGGETKIIKSGVTPEKDVVEVQWYKDGEKIPNATNSDYEVTESGKYKVVANYKEIKCEVAGEIEVEIYPSIKESVNSPQTVVACRFVTEATPIDLTVATQNMFTKPGVDKANYDLSYYKDSGLTQKINTPNAYLVDIRTNQSIYIQVQDKRTSCIEKFEAVISFVKGEEPMAINDVLICGNYTLPTLPQNQKYYSQAGGKGTRFNNGDILGIGKHQLFVLQDNGNNCYEEISYTIEVTEKPILQEIPNTIYQCELFTLPRALPNNKYYIESNGNRIEVMPGTEITQTNTKIYIVAKSDNGICVEENSFIVQYEDCPIPKGFSPNGDGVNDRFDLSQHGVTSLKIFNRTGSEVYFYSGNYTNQWEGKDKNGKQLPSGTYYYVIQAFGKTRTGWVEINH
ncbi:MAG: choice-of-anchor J domain-containing protein [Flavobacteriaceae bacterium]|jgi:gliding motility-associated-like protein|nr:choice-of-anchor J domain-containing protein [Flavobacteriaceae bacterium]